MADFRTATLNDLSLVLDWAAREGWNPGLDDAAAFFEADPNGFFVACDEGVPVAAISVVNHSPDFAFLGLYIVLPQRRHEGVGLALWNHAIMHAGDRVVGLDGVPDQQENYRKSGFVSAGGTTRYSGTVPATKHAQIRPVQDHHIPELIALEGSASGTHKSAYLQAWFAGAKTRVTLTEERAGQLQGACTVRRCREGAKIGPLIARDLETARRLLEHAATLFPGPVVLDVPDASNALAQLCAAYGMSPSFKTARMYRGKAPKASAPVDFFAVVSLELG